ncbi:MAG TPA: hypothetical protein VMN77_07500 [Nitrospiria bacterium]|jgi:hypothetical protein|nr:hypothetical protein [Nitrospiria bacterium]
MKTAIRILAVLFVVPATSLFVIWMPFSFIPLGEQRWVVPVVSSLCAIVAGRYVWVKTGKAPHGVVSSIFYGGVVVGGIGFSAGFFGPIIFAPEANQGPLLGIFITGPLGFLLGGLGGLVYGLMHREKTGAD